MPWKTLNTWLFDGSRQSPVPEILYNKKSNKYIYIYGF